MNFLEKIWSKLFTFRLIRRKLSMRYLKSIGKNHGSSDSTLVVYVEFPFEKYFPNHTLLTELKYGTDGYYEILGNIASNSYPQILCTGLLEHMKEPKRLVDEMFRILEPGGRLIMSVSAVFPFHRSPENYFHFTPYGLRLIMQQEWKDIQICGSTKPFETLGILMQRTLLQSHIFPVARPIIEFLAWTIRVFDIFIVKQYDTRNFSDSQLTESFMPSNLLAIAKKK